MPINRRTARKNRGASPTGVTKASPVTITRRDGSTVTEPPHVSGRSARAFDMPEPAGASSLLEWEHKTDPKAGIGFMVARHGLYHARADGSDDGWRWVVWTSGGRVARGAEQTFGLARKAVEDVVFGR